MNFRHAPRGIGVNTQLRPTPDTHLYGRWLVLARVSWIALIVLILAGFIALFPGFVALETGQLPHALNVSASGSFAVTITLTIASMMLCFAVACVLFWRRSDDWMALLVALMQVLLGTNYVAATLQQSPSPERGPALILSNVTFAVFFLVGCLFPNGRFVPRWIGWLPVAWIVWSTAFSVLYLFFGIPFTFHVLVWLTTLICLVVVQLYRYHRVSTFVQRQQTKWGVFGLSIIIVEVLLVSLLLRVFPSLVPSGFVSHLLDVVGYTLPLFLGSLSLAIAILRSNLWDIDILINRTLVYGTLTSTLALVYVGLVIGLQALLRNIISQDNSVAIVLSTLAIYVLFQPLRQGIQRLIDRRFYRSKYDAAKIIAAYSATLRQEVDLDQLQNHLLAVVQETMQSAHVSLWLRTSEQDGKQRAPWRATPSGSSEGG
jgi:hypothetical protein